MRMSPQTRLLYADCIPQTPPAALPRHYRHREASMRHILQRIHRRGFVAGLFGGAAAAGLAGRAAAETPAPVPCQLGPAPHQKGPLVWMDMDQADIDAA